MEISTLSFSKEHWIFGLHSRAGIGGEERSDDCPEGVGRSFGVSGHGVGTLVLHQQKDSWVVASREKCASCHLIRHECKFEVAPDTPKGPEA